MIKDILLALHQRPVAYFPLYAKGAGSVTTGVLLSQLLYWAHEMKGKEFYKEDSELLLETALTLDQLKSAKSAIKKMVFVSVSLKGIPARTHYLFDFDKLGQWIGEAAKATDGGKSTIYMGENPPHTKRKIHHTQSGKSTAHKAENPLPNTETTVKKDTDTTAENFPAKKLAGIEKPKKLNWSKESAKVFDLVQKQETRRDGIDIAAFDWHVNKGENFRQLQNLRDTIIRNMNIKKGVDVGNEVDWTDYSATLEVYLTWAWKYYRKQQQLTGVINYTPTACYRDFNKIKTYASNQKGRERTSISETSPFFEGIGG